VAVFAALALVTRLLCLDPDQSTVFWPANGALVVAMLLLPARLCLPALLACFGINLALNAFTNYTAFDSAVYSVLNIVGSALVALATRRFCGATTDLTRVRRLATFGCIAFLSAALEATLGETIDPSGTTGSAVMKDWLQWIMCDGLGFLLATPAILLSVKNVGSGDVCHAGWKERWLLLVGTTAITTVSFLFAHSPAFMLIYPIIILTAFRAGPPWVLASILITAMVSSAFTAHGYGPFARLASGDTLLSQELVQPFLVSIFLAAVPANSALGEKNRASRRLSQMKAAIEHTATHDGLTTLANRDLFRRRLGAMLRSGAECAVLFVDLDRFKQVNDTMGHAAGDELLRAFSARLLMIAGPNATVARFGGDEFALLVPCCASAGDAEDLCRRITEVALLPFLLTGGEAHVSASVGVAFASAWALDASELMRRADIALYTVKAEGRNGFRIFSDSLDRLACDRAEIEADLRIALQQEGQLELHYQTKVDADGIVRGVEALLRWRHPTRGFIPPARLIPVAEETGLIIPLGEWVLREALQFATRWPQLNIAINVSPVQLRSPRFVQDTLKLCSRWQVSYGRLELEVTESALMDDVNIVNGKLAVLRSAGIRIALDDFGTGYSSLRHLHRCAVDRVKIDQSFVSGLDGSGEAAAIIRAVIQLGHAMGLQVTAEGVESESQYRFLVEAGVDELQGFLFSRPVEENRLAAAMGVSGPQDFTSAAQGVMLIHGGLHG
jgi:diguanylate cyclase (GGDEF)-like protein